MSDTPDTSAAGAVDPTAPVVAGAGAAPPAAPAPAPTAEPDPFGDLPADQAVFDRGYVDQLRREGAKFRTDYRSAQEQLAAYEDVYGVYEPADRDVWFDLARQWAVDPAAAAAVMQSIAAAVLDDGGEQPGTAPPPEQPKPSAAGGAAASPGPITAEQVAEYVRAEMERAETARAQEAMIESIYSTMRAGGVEPKSSDGMAVLWIANNETDGDIDKALSAFKANRQRAVDEYVAGRSGKPPPAPEGVVASAHSPINNLDDARKAADAFIKSQAAAS